MKGAARKGDTVILDNCAPAPPNNCGKCAHGPMPGILNIGPFSMTTKINGRAAARVTDTGKVNCPHGGVFVIIKGASKTVIDGLQAARLGDQVQCTVCGSPGRIIPPLSTDTFTVK